ncbi:tRNA (adenosine(37)-N6)-threonylcarbamoyltransferase complex ATPase subunit type 1 TsaE [Pedobacter sp. HMF7647]|uniref:tRNA threonylcarbamoyladenosine biosynthesis protein TsaE n=1 Tax=Hufsiella arboris TaxID=2695275 RepID=A0A7K1Y5R3_9SPHI|nr:tRNA (adenosine(37)-N6)-threonylcarbamoyltransferase complex ATPase subunit type 1 TsaE [Hufsiella arboris]MXV49741.1 tRNA (adenosine(37)-N6)-threonylcarbamoyltransferase complex ATPase subunit type 1 TsaE [Hufsiella arboris]
MNTEFLAPAPEDLPVAAASLLNKFPSERVFLFYGDMGAGKTTFIKALCQSLGVQASVSSPTFSIVNEYPSEAGPVYHFDFYRIKTQEEALDIGIEEYFYSSHYCFVEWPEKIPDLIPAGAVKVTITIQPDSSRLIKADEV